MAPDFWMWVVIDVAAVAILGGALAWGITQRRRRRDDPRTSDRPGH